MPAPYETHRAQLKAILLAWGMPEDNAETTADILGWADLHGVDSHGISMLPGYDRLRRSGRANMAARPRIIKETPVSALIDGDGGLGHVPARFAMQGRSTRRSNRAWRSWRCATRPILGPPATTL
jgi:LDH2 family malate/lactate/ureidoglycolate dehydrogenase